MTMVEICLLLIVGAFGCAIAKLTAISNALSRINNQLAVLIELDVEDRRERRWEETRKVRDAVEVAEAERAPPRPAPFYTGPDWAKP